MKHWLSNGHCGIAVEQTSQCWLLLSLSWRHSIAIPLHAPHQDLCMINIMGVSLWIVIMKLYYLTKTIRYANKKCQWNNGQVYNLRKNNKKCYPFFASSRPFSIVIQLMCLPNPTRKFTACKWRLFTGTYREWVTRITCRIIQSIWKFNSTTYLCLKLMGPV